MKNCPHCGKAIKDESIKCRYCHEWLDKTNSMTPASGEEPKLDAAPSEINQMPASCDACGYSPLKLIKRYDGATGFECPACRNFIKTSKDEIINEKEATVISPGAKSLCRKDNAEPALQITKKIKINRSPKGISITIAATIVFLSAAYLPGIIEGYYRLATGAVVAEYMIGVEALSNRVLSRSGMEAAVLEVAYMLPTIEYVLRSGGRKAIKFMIVGAPIEKKLSDDEFVFIDPDIWERNAEIKAIPDKLRKPNELLSDLEYDALRKKAISAGRKSVALTTSFCISLFLFVLLSAAKRTELILINNNTFRLIAASLLVIGLVTFTLGNGYIHNLKEVIHGTSLIYAFLILVLLVCLYLVSKIYKIVNEHETRKKENSMPKFSVSFYKIIAIAGGVMASLLVPVLGFIISQYCYLAFVKMMKYQADNSYSKWIAIALIGTAVSIINVFIAGILISQY